MKNLLVKAISILAIIVACEYANAFSIDFEGNYVIVRLKYHTYYVDVTKELAKNDTEAILKKVCEKVPVTCAN